MPRQHGSDGRRRSASACRSAASRAARSSGHVHPCACRAVVPLDEGCERRAYMRCRGRLSRAPHGARLQAYFGAPPRYERIEGAVQRGGGSVRRFSPCETPSSAPDRLVRGEPPVTEPDKRRECSAQADVASGPLVERPIFIVGDGRSGTTLLRGLLSAHSRLAITPETQYMAKAELAGANDAAAPDDAGYPFAASSSWRFAGRWTARSIPLLERVETSVLSVLRRWSRRIRAARR